MVYRLWNFLVVQRLGLTAFTAVAWIQFLVGELRSHKHCVMAKRETYQFNMFKRKLSTEELMLLNCSVGEDSSQTLGWQGDQPSQFKGNQS